MTKFGWPGYSGGPLGTLAPLPVGLNTMVVSASDFSLGRPDPTRFRRDSHVPFPWEDIKSRRVEDTTPDTKKGDGGIVLEGLGFTYGQ